LANFLQFKRMLVLSGGLGVGPYPSSRLRHCGLWYVC